jgi:N-acetylglucosaminyldiphosphoundecaprenol N-acetyl-beta-D-mannosaminyltransferase
MRRISLFGVEVDQITLPELHAVIAHWIEGGHRGIIANHNLHSVYLYHRDERMRAFYATAEVIFIDGMPLVYWGRFLGKGLDRVHRITYVDWIRPLLAYASSQGWRVFYLGGKPGVAEKAARILRQEFPTLILATHHGYFDMYGEENKRVLEVINAFKPHLLLVGMGMPRQEHWVLENHERVFANVILTAGACFDYIAGAIPTPPRWAGQLGLEWLFRLLAEPRRLWRRYLVEPWTLLPCLWRDVLTRVGGGKSESS